MKHYIGIDVSSRKLNIHITDQENGDYEIPNTVEAIQDFITKLELDPSQYIVGAESTGRYHLKTQNCFVQSGFDFRLLNPILTNKVIAATIRKKKTDKSDAEIITFLLSQGEGQLISGKQLQTTKKSVLRTRHAIVRYKTAIKVLLSDLKREEPSPQIALAVTTLEGLIANLETGAKELSDNATASQSEEETLIQSIPGFATKLAAVVASEVGDFRRFPSARQFKAYVGIDPKVIQSGDSSRTSRITKRGNPYLRYAFYLAAQVARQYDPEIKQFFEKKMNEGKHFNVAVCAVARKLCERVYAVVIKKAPYEIRQVQSA